MEYSVKTGDTIAAVTRLMGVSFNQLKKSNPDAFGRSRSGNWFLMDGTRLVVGDSARPDTPQPPQTTTSISPPQVSEMTEYTVQTGETIKSVTDRFGLSFQSLKKSNPGALGRTSDGRWFLYSGARIQVPQPFANAMSEAASKAAQPLSAPPEPQTPEVTPNVPALQAPLPAPALDHTPPDPKVSSNHSHPSSPDPGSSRISHSHDATSSVDSVVPCAPDRPMPDSASSASDCPFVAKNLIGFKFDF